MALDNLERDAVALVQSYGLAAVLSYYAEKCRKQSLDMNLKGSDRQSLAVLSTLLLSASQQSQKTPRTVKGSLGVRSNFCAK
jgi:hypothetical protein